MADFIFMGIVPRYFVVYMAVDLQPLIGCAERYSQIPMENQAIYGATPDGGNPLFIFSIARNDIYTSEKTRLYLGFFLAHKLTTYISCNILFNFSCSQSDWNGISSSKNRMRGH